MSAPDTNLERQKTRHTTMATGLWVGAGIAALVAAVFIVATLFGVDVIALVTSAV